MREAPHLAARVIRAAFERGARATAAEMMPHVPDKGVRARLDLPYADGGADTTLDLFTPDSVQGPLPTVVWIHGGAWISGSKRDVAPYLRILAGQGYAAVGLNYTIAPGATYPTVVRQINDALDYLIRHADQLRIDPHRFVLAGDSAGAQLASQLAAMITNPSYAQEVGIRPALPAEHLRGVILHCGIYDLGRVQSVPGVVGWGFRVALSAYSGSREWSQTPAGTQMSIMDRVTADFPRTFISGGDGDALTVHQSVPLAERLSDLGVPVDALFFAPGHGRAMPHEYQFHLDFPEAQDALQRTYTFLEVTAATP